jgi:hypothetical protein
LPQRLQLLGSLFRSTHRLLQQTPPLGQAPVVLPQVHCPFTHVSPLGHTVPQLPQLFLSNCRLVQALPQTP